MPTLADIYEEQAEECIRCAAKTANPKHRDMLLNLARAWQEDAEGLRRGAEGSLRDAPVSIQLRR
jgi:hypothetical protein